MKGFTNTQGKKRSRTPRLLIAAGLLVLAGCMVSPRHGETVPSRMSNITFGVYTSVEDSIVQFQSARFDAAGNIESWFPTAGCQATKGGFADGMGDRHYYCTVKTPLLYTNNWTRAGVPPGYAYRAEIRAMVKETPGGTWLPTFTFDAGVDTTNCIIEQFSESGRAVAENCSRGGQHMSATVYVED